MDTLIDGTGSIPVFDWASFAPERVAYFSDLHVEFAPFSLDPDLQADMAIIAGDVHTKARGALWARSLGIPCVMVMGNHDYYGDTLGRAASRAKQDVANSRVALLDDDELVLANCRILGSTLWTDYNLYGNATAAMRFAEGNLRDPYSRGMADHRKIRNILYSKARASDFATLHAKSKRFLDARLATPFDHPTIIVTHHAPSKQSLLDASLAHPDPFDPCYASDLELFMGAARAQAWIHGHLHSARDYHIAGTRILCNPRGYPGEASAFSPTATFLVSELARQKQAQIPAP